MLFNHLFSLADTLRRSGIALTLLACSGFPAYAQNFLPEPVLRELEKAGIAPQAMSAIVVPAGSQQTHLDWGADTLRLPASTMKLVPTLIGLEELGPAYRWKTELLSAGTPRKGILHSPLYLRGGADPDLHPDTLRAMLRELHAQGTHHLHADLVLDRSYFNPIRTDIGAPDFDEFPRAYYNVIPDALTFNENFLKIYLEADANKLTVRTEPPLQAVRIANQLQLVDMPCASWDDDTLLADVGQPKGKGRVVTITLRGDFPRSCKRSTSQNLMERNLYIERFVRAAWSELGGTWRGSLREGTAPIGAQALVSRNSRTMTEIAAQVNKPSNNTMARMLFLSLGELRYQGPPLATSRDKADAVVRAWFARHGIDPAGMVFENGSGLSRIERLSPRQLAALLEVGRKSNWSAEFAASMPIVGVDGTMRNRLKGTVTQGRARAKTGTLNNTSAIAGYVRDVHDREWIVAGMVGNPTYGGGVPAINALLRWVAEGAGLPQP